MPNVALIGYGAMARYVVNQLADSPWILSDCICRAGREDAARGSIGEGPNFVLGIDDMSALPDLVVDCSGHEGLRAHAAAFLSKGVPVISASLGALADPDTYKSLSDAAAAGGTQLKLVSGALGCMMALRLSRERFGRPGVKDALIGMALTTFAGSILAGTMALPFYGTMFGPFTLAIIFWVAPLTLVLWISSLTGVHFLLRKWQEERDSIFVKPVVAPQRSGFFRDILRDLQIR